MKRAENQFTIRNTFKQMLAEKQAEGLSKATLDSYLVSLQIFLADNGLDDTAEVNILTKEFIISWLNKRLEYSKPITVNHYMREMRVYIYYLQDRGLLEQYRLSTIKCQEHAIKGYTLEEVKLLLAKPSHVDTYTIWRSWAITNFILSTGARAGSICTLRKEDINYNSRLITFNHTKSKRFLQVPITDSLRAVLQAFESEWQNDSPLVFPSNVGEICKPHGLLDAFNDYCKYRQVKSQGLHALRHTFARMSIENGMDVYTLQRILGHANITQTVGYVHILTSDLNTSAIPLDNILKDNKIKRR